MNAKQYERLIAAARQLWRLSRDPFCMGCGKPGAMEGHWRLQVHEIERRSHARNRWGIEANYLLLHPECHADAFASMSHTEQLAHKLICDPECFDLAAWLCIDNTKSPLRITLEEVLREVPEVQRRVGCCCACGRFGCRLNTGTGEMDCANCGTVQNTAQLVASYSGMIPGIEAITLSI